MVKVIFCQLWLRLKIIVITFCLYNVILLILFYRSSRSLFLQFYLLIIILILIAQIGHYLFFKILKWLFSCDIIYCYAPISISIVSLGYRSESFLASSIPYLHFHNFVVNLQCFNFEINTNSGKWVFIKYIVWKPQQERRLARTSISYKDNFIESFDLLVYILWVFHHSGSY